MNKNEILCGYEDERHWYTIEELASLCGFSVETLQKGNSPLNDLSIDFKVETRFSGYHNTKKFYSENVLKVGEQKIFKKLLDDGYIKVRYSTDGVKFYDPCFGYERYFETIHVPFIKGDKKLSRDKLMLNHDGFMYFRKRYAV